MKSPAENADLRSMIERLLRRWLPFKELGWWEYDEHLTRFIVVKLPWFSVYIHKLVAQQRPPLCHDHPWHFWAIVLGAGYWEEIRGQTVWRGPGSVLYRTAKSSHNTITQLGANWSIIVVSHRKRSWAKLPCG